MNFIERLLEEGGGYRAADRIDLTENGSKLSLIPNYMNDSLAGWRDLMRQKGDKEIEIVGKCSKNEESRQYQIKRIYAKIDRSTLKILVEWMVNDRISFITTTAPFTVFWQGDQKHSLLDTPTTKSKEALGD
jgi:hypothetical protein